MFKKILHTQIKDTTRFKVLCVRVFIFVLVCVSVGGGEIGSASNKLNISPHPHPQTTISAKKITGNVQVLCLFSVL